MERQSFRVNTGIQIEVNDAGEYIVAYVTDQNFVEKFYKLVEKTDEIAAYMSSAEIDKLDTREKLRVSIEKSKEVMQGIDTVFGERASEKIFGVGVVPTGYALCELFEQLIPVFE